MLCDACRDTFFGSIELFESYIPDPHEPVWDAWAKHVNYFKLLQAKEFTEKDVVVLDKAIYVAQAAFKKAFGGKGLFKPKQHFTSHASVTIVRAGPMREYWCYSYEGMHQRVKRISKNSNWRNVSKRIMRFWCWQFACVMAARGNERIRLSNLA